MTTEKTVREVPPALSLVEGSTLTVRQDELAGSYQVDDGDGNKIAAIVPLGETPLKWFLRLLGWGEVVSRRLEVRDADGQRLLEVKRSRGVLSSKFLLLDADGGELGQIFHQRQPGRKRFDFTVAGAPAGALEGDWSATEFSVLDQDEQIVARLAKGVGSVLGLTPDKYLVGIERTPDGPLGWLVLVAAVCADLTFHDE